MITPIEAQQTYTLGEPMLVADAVIDLVGKYPEQFDMSYWEYDLSEQDSCGSAACIAGWVGLLHNESHRRLKKSLFIFTNQEARIRVMDSWERRQAERLGLTEAAGNILFTLHTNELALDVLTSVSKWHTHNTGLIDTITMRALIDGVVQTDG